MDAFTQELPAHLAPKSVNNYLGLVRAVLNFVRKRGRLQFIPYVPPSRCRKSTRSGTQRTSAIASCLASSNIGPSKWYLFFYLTVRLGLRRGEVYAISRRQVREVPPRLIVDQAAQWGTVERPALIVTRKNDEAYTLPCSSAWGCGS